MPFRFVLKKGGWVLAYHSKKYFLFVEFFGQKGLVHTIKFDLKKNNTRLLQCCKGAHVFLGGVLFFFFFDSFLTSI